MYLLIEQRVTTENRETALCEESVGRGESDVPSQAAADPFGDAGLFLCDNFLEQEDVGVPYVWCFADFASYGGVIFHHGKVQRSHCQRLSTGETHCRYKEGQNAHGYHAYRFG